MALDQFRSTLIKLDKANQFALENQFAKQGDANGRVLRVQLSNAGIIEDQSGIELNLKWRNIAKGNEGYDSFEVEDASQGLYKFVYPTAMTSVPGTLECDIEIVENGTLTNTRSFRITVEGSAVSDSAAESDNSFTALQEAVLKVNNLEENYAPRLTELTGKLAEKAKQDELEATGKRIDELIIGSGNANAEVTDAHVSTTKNKTFTTISNRIEEIEKDNNYLMENKALNSDFQTNTTSWYGGGSTLSHADSKLVATGIGAADYIAAMQNTGINLTSGDKWFIKFLATPTNGVPDRFRIVARGQSQIIIKNITEGLAVDSPIQASVIYQAVDSSILTYGIQAMYPTAADATGKAFTVDKVVLVNLTQNFGAGLEPSETEMIALINKYSDSYFFGKVSAVDFKKLFNDVKRADDNIKNTEKLNSSFSNQVRRSQITTRTPYEFTVSGSSTSAKRPIWTITYDDEAKNVHDYGLPIHESENVPAAFYAVPNRIGTDGIYNYGSAMTWNELHDLKNAGWEIGHHTVDHLNTSYMDRKQLIENVEEGNQLFIEHGIYPKHFSHPGGSNTYSNSNTLKEYFDSSALTVNGVNGYDLNPWRLKRKSADSWYTAIYNSITQLGSDGEGWLISYHHAIHPDGKVVAAAGEMTCWTPEQLQTAIQYAKSLGIEVVTMDEGLRTYAPYLYYFDEVNDPAYAVQRDGLVQAAKPIII